MINTFGELFKNKRQSYSQIYVAEKLGVTQSYISQIECGIKKPTLDFIEKARKELGFELMVIDIDKEKELLINMIEKLKPIDLKKVVEYTHRFCEVKDE